MTVNFDSTTNIAKVTDDRVKTISDQQTTIKNLQDQAAQKDKTISDLQSQVSNLQANLDNEQSRIAVVFNGYVDGYAKFNGSYWKGEIGDCLTPGSDNIGKSEGFSRAGIEQPTGMKYIGKTNSSLLTKIPFH